MSQKRSSINNFNMLRFLVGMLFTFAMSFSSEVSLHVYYPEEYIQLNSTMPRGDIIWNVGYSSAPYSKDIVQTFDSVYDYQPWFMNLTVNIDLSNRVAENHFVKVVDLGDYVGVVYFEISQDWLYHSITQCPSGGYGGFCLPHKR
jgi:hypothetical protein